MVGFEPTKVIPPNLQSGAFVHSATHPIIGLRFIGRVFEGRIELPTYEFSAHRSTIELLEHYSTFFIIFYVYTKIKKGCGGIRTHEQLPDNGFQNRRLSPLGHAPFYFLY